MGWFRPGQRDHDDSQDDPARQGAGSAKNAERRELFLPGATADEDINEGRGFFLLGGPQQSGDVPFVSVDDEGHSYVAVGGRKLSADVPDILPKDDQEVNRLDFQHYMLRYALKGNYAAPVQQPTGVLDVGCGTGRWAMEVAHLFPGANVIGLDLAEIVVSQMSEHLPENYLFVAGNLLEGLPFADGSFDFTHMRLLFTAIPANRWPQVVSDLVRVTRRGGWVELVEGSLPQNGGPAMDAINLWISEVSGRRGIDLRLGAQIGNLLQGVRLRNVVAREIMLPVGRAGGRIGQMAAADTFAMIESLRALVTAQRVATPEEYEYALTTARAEIDRGQWRCVRPFYLAYGQHG